MKKKKFLIFSGVVSLAIAAGGGYVLYQRRQYKMVTEYATHESTGPRLSFSTDYHCSKPVKVKVTGGYDGIVPYAIPVNQSEANLFCYSPGSSSFPGPGGVNSDPNNSSCGPNCAIEYKGKLTVLQRPEVLEMISKYAYKDVAVKALEFKYIQDKNYVHRLLPAYKDRDIGCIIIVQTPNEKKVYLEDDKLETFEELDYKTFESYLNQVSPADRQLFYDNLR